MYNFFKNILDFIFPIECVGCGKEGKWLCDYCFSKIEFNKKQVCPLCGREIKTGYSCLCTVGAVSSIKYQVSSSSELGNKSCGNERTTAFSQDGGYKGVDIYITIVDLKKNPAVMKLIHKLKYSFVESAAKDLGKIGIKFLGRNLKFEIRNLLFGEDVIWMPVPLHKRRLLWRGFNQSELILDELVFSIGKPHPNHPLKWEGINILVRRKNTLFQGKSKMAEAERRENMRGAFEARHYGVILNFKFQILKQFLISNFQFFKKKHVNNDNKTEIRDDYFLNNKTIVLFDDVITTGATMEECARVLKEAGALRVIAMAVGKG